MSQKLHSLHVQLSLGELHCGQIFLPLFLCFWVTPNTSQLLEASEIGKNVRCKIKKVHSYLINVQLSLRCIPYNPDGMMSLFHSTIMFKKRSKPTMVLQIEFYPYWQYVSEFFEERNETLLSHMENIWNS